MRIWLYVFQNMNFPIREEGKGGSIAIREEMPLVELISQISKYSNQVIG